MRIRRLAMLLGATALLAIVFSDRTGLTGSGVQARTVEFAKPINAKSGLGLVTPELQGSANQGKPTRPRAKLTLLVDGGTNPSAIPDRIAYYHFIQSNAQPGVLNGVDVRRREVRLGRLGLSKDDYRALAEALAGVKDQLTLIEVTGRVASTSPFVLKEQRDQVLESVRARLRNTLSPDGASRLQTFINDNVKRRVQIFGGPWVE